MKLTNTVSTSLIICALLVAQSGSQAKEGPAEQAGKKVDKATEQAGEEIHDAAKGDAE